MCSHGNTIDKDGMLTKLEDIVESTEVEVLSNEPQNECLALSDCTACLTSSSLEGEGLTNSFSLSVATGLEPNTDSITKPNLNYGNVEEDDEKKNVKATKLDKAPIPVEIWRYHLSQITGVALDESWESKAAPLPKVLQSIWRRSIVCDFLVYLHQKIAEAVPCPDWLEETYWWNGRKAREQCSTPKGVIWSKETGSYTWTHNWLKQYKWSENLCTLLIQRT